MEPPAEPRLNGEPSTTSFVDTLIQDAFDDRATDIHIEPFEERVDVRYRVDGVMHHVPVPKEITKFQRSIVSRLKILAHLDIAEQRLPQDGRFRFTLPDHTDLDIRISVLPTPFGESVDLRLLPTEQVYTGLGSLGLSQADQGKVESILKTPHGVVLVTGPTGSGKTTTLYAFLALLNDSDRKILTIEDPIEYQIPGLTQIQINPKIGLTFARGLRSMLRHDPDIMMVGEIRDHETAETAIQVALTGHLVFSTVHTNDSPSTPTRLVNMGVEPYLLGASVECIIAQRLVRLVCDVCRQKRGPPASDPLLGEIAEQLRAFQIPWDGEISDGRGCEACRGTGYRGRTAIYEILPMSQKIQSLVLERAPSTLIRSVAEEEGFRSMRYDGLVKIAEKRTTYEEVLRVTRKHSY
jgi:general secretion pathway protein E/type IV pilus assembly protein PilB